MPANGHQSSTDDTFAGEFGSAGSAQILRPTFGRQRLSGAAEQSATSSTSPTWENIVLTNVLRITELKQGWDSYDAPPIRWDAGLFSLIILRNAMRPETPVPQVVPSSVGGIQLEWHERSIDLELHITGPYECEVWYEDHSRPEASPIAEEISNDFSLIQQFIDELTSRGAPVAHAV